MRTNSDVLEKAPSSGQLSDHGNLLARTKHILEINTGILPTGKKYRTRDTAAVKSQICDQV